MKLEEIYKLFLTCSGIATDTRKIATNSLFVALKGTNFDANTFAAAALQNGAKYAIIDNPIYELNERTILVENALETLQKLATFHRKMLGTTIISLTGSNGKTTTKELINCVLATKYKTIATIGNLNNHIGVPLTLLRLTKDTEIGIIEMGANHKKEIELLCEIAQPDYGYITNYGKAHLEGFGGIEGVIKGKSEMYDYLRKQSKIAVLNYDDLLQQKNSQGIKNIGYSKINDQGTFISRIASNPMVQITFEETVINSQLIGLYNADNIIAAITIGKEFKLSNNEIKAAIEAYIPSNNRSQLIQVGSNEILLDAYNANPSSMEVALLNFNAIDKINKIAILGDMFELGTESAFEHKKIIENQSKNIDLEIYFIGEHFFQNKNEQEKRYFFKDFESFKAHLLNIKIENSNILIKGSRGMALERTLEIL